MPTFEKIFVCLTLFCASFCVSACQQGIAKSGNLSYKVITPAEPEPTPPINREPITIAAAGDIMLGSTFPNETRMPPNDGKDSLKSVAPLLAAADIAFANLEGPLIDGGDSTKCPPPPPRH